METTALLPKIARTNPRQLCSIASSNRTDVSVDHPQNNSKKNRKQRVSNDNHNTQNCAEVSHESNQEDLIDRVVVLYIIPFKFVENLMSRTSLDVDNLYHVEEQDNAIYKHEGRRALGPSDDL